MSVYDRRYHVSANYVSSYTDDPRVALRNYEKGLAAYHEGRTPNYPWASEGHSEDTDMGAGVTQVTRAGDRQLTYLELQFRAARRDVQDLIARLRRVDN